MLPAERFDRLEKKIADAAAKGADADRFTTLERKLDDIARIFTAGGELLTQEDLTDLRSDIVSLRRELRSGLGQGEADLGELMRTLVARVEQLPQGTPATVADLEAQMERIARILEDPNQSRVDLAHIEASLKTIEQRLEDTRLSFERAKLEGDDAAAAGAEMKSVAGLARSLSDDVSVLKSSTESTERKTRDAIDAVQDTLEAVVKRMAFLERDADAASASEARRPAEPRVSQPIAAAPEPEVEEVSEVEQAQAPDVVPEPRVAPDLSDQPPSSLLGRLTSRQLLKRATGGRAESFSPEAEESDDASDFPLEPGTDAPLSSALSGAPSSNTEFMSGARKGRLVPPLAPDGGRHRAVGRGEPQPAADDDFLAAARRAARAAAQETSDDGEAAPVEQRSRGFFSRHRRSLLAAAIAAALIIAAIPLLRTQIWPADTDFASAPEVSTQAASEASSEAPSATPMQPVASAPAPAAPESSMSAAAPEARRPQRRRTSPLQHQRRRPLRRCRAKPRHLPPPLPTCDKQALGDCVPGRVEHRAGRDGSRRDRGRAARAVCCAARRMSPPSRLRQRPGRKPPLPHLHPMPPWRHQLPPTVSRYLPRYPRRSDRRSFATPRWPAILPPPLRLPRATPRAGASSRI